MKMTIALMIVLFSAGSAMAQTPDSIPPGNSKKWNLDTTMKKPSTDSSLGNWKQDSSAQKPQEDTAQHKKPLMDEKLTDRAIMKDGEMTVLKNGEVSKMEKDLVLPSGTIIKTDGTVKKKDGTEVKLKDGQYIELPSAETDKKKTGKKTR